MASLTLGRYVPYDSFIHKLDPRTKLLAMVVIMVTIFLRFSTIFVNLAVYAFIFLCVSIIMKIAHLKFSQLFKQLKALWVMVVFLLVINILVPNTSEIATFFEIGDVRIYHASLLQTFYIIFRLILMISLTVILTGSTRPLDLTYAIEWYMLPLKPFKFPTHEVAMTIAIALRFIPTLLEETMRIMKAQASRGVDFVDGKMKEKVRAIVSLIVPLFMSAFQRSEELANAMEARGYDPQAKRTRYRQLTWSSKDWIAFVMLIVYVALMMIVPQWIG